jgi:hypothetical protein
MVQMKSTHHDAKKILDRLCATVDRLFTLTGMLRGSITMTHRRCGKENCWCAPPDQKGHPSTRLVWVDATGSKTRSIRDDDLNEISQAIEQHRSFKLLRKQLRDDEQCLDKVLNEFENRTVIKNRIEKGFM